MRPVSTTSIAFAASGLVRTNHCVEISGSTTVLQRSHLPHRQRVRLHLFKQPQLLQILHHALPRFHAVEPGISARRGGHLAVLVDHFDARQVVPLARLEIVRIVRRRHLHRARAELRIRQIVQNHRDRPVHQRQIHGPPVQMRVPRILGVHRHRRIAQHRLRPRSRHHHVRGRVPDTGYRMCHKLPCVSSFFTSRSEIAVWQRGHQFTMYSPR